MSPSRSRLARTSDSRGERFAGARLILLYLGAAAVAQVLVVLPTSLLLLPIGGPYAPSVILNVMMLHLLWCVARRERGRAWLLLPALFYGGWLVFSFVEKGEARQVQRELRPGAPVRGAGAGAREIVLLVGGDTTWANPSNDQYQLQRVRPNLTVYIEGCPAGLVDEACRAAPPTKTVGQLAVGRLDPAPCITRNSPDAGRRSSRGGRLFGSAGARRPGVGALWATSTSVRPPMPRRCRFSPPVACPPTSGGAASTGRGVGACR